MSAVSSGPQPQIIEHYLLIEPVVNSLAPKFLYFFKPKEVLQGEKFQLILRATNKGVAHFPGGELINAQIIYNQDPQHPIGDQLGVKNIEPLAPNETVDIDCGIWQALYPGVMRVESKVVAKDSISVGCYQKLPGSGKSSLMPGGSWVDFVPVNNETEMQQRYTNKILVILTLATVIYYLLSLFLQFPILKFN